MNQKIRSLQKNRSLQKAQSLHGTQSQPLKSFRLCGVLICLSTVLAGCSKTDSGNVKTSGFYASYSVSGNNQNSVNCSATFQVGGSTGTYLNLNAGDSVTCNGNSMSRSELAGMISYSASVPFVSGGTYTITLSRTSETPYQSSVVLPEPITGYSPSAAFSIQKGAALTPTWNPSSSAFDSMRISLSYNGSGSSFSESHSEIDTSPEDGSVGFGSGDTSRSPASFGTWTGTLTYQRYRYGTVATGLDGIISASQSVSVGVSLTD